MNHPLPPGDVASLRAHLQQIIEGLPSEVPARRVPRADLARVRAAIESLPLSSGEYCVALNRFLNARRYLAAGERGAAAFELRLLARIFDDLTAT